MAWRYENVLVKLALFAALLCSSAHSLVASSTATNWSLDSKASWTNIETKAFSEILPKISSLPKSCSRDQGLTKEELNTSVTKLPAEKSENSLHSVFAVAALRRCPELKTLSETQWWRKINGWTSSDKEPSAENISSAAYSSTLGQQSAHLDLISFLSDWILSSPKKENIQCRFPTKIRFIRVQRSAMDGTWQSWFQRLLSRVSPCKEFEKWAHVNSIEGMSLILASASTSSAASIFGHSMLTVDHDLTKTDFGPGYLPYFYFGVPNEIYDKAGTFEKIVLGLGGGFGAQLTNQPFFIVRQEQLVKMRRTLRYYRMNISNEKFRDIMERLWEGLRWGTAYRYYFFTENCASLMTEFLSAAFEPQLEVNKTSGFLITPGRELKKLSDEKMITQTSVEDRGSENWAIRVATERERTGKALLTDYQLKLLNSHDRFQRMSGYKTLTEERHFTPQHFYYLLTSISMEEFESNLRTSADQALDESYDGLLDIYADLNRRYSKNASEGKNLYSRWETSEVGRQKLREENQLHSAGYWNTSLGYAASFTKNQNANLIRLQTGFFDEPLGGNQAFHATDSGEIKLLTGTFYFDPTGSSPVPIFMLIPFSYTSLKRTVPVVDHWSKRLLGWRFKISFERDYRLDPRTDATPELSLVSNLYESEQFANHIFLALGIGLPQAIYGGDEFRFTFPAEVVFRKQLFQRPWTHIDLSLAFKPYFGFSEHEYRTINKISFETLLGTLFGAEIFLQSEMAFHYAWKETGNPRVIEGMMGFRGGF